MHTASCIDISHEKALFGRDSLRCVMALQIYTDLLDTYQAAEAKVASATTWCIMKSCVSANCLQTVKMLVVEDVGVSQVLAK